MQSEEMIEPTEEERNNGWTKETLTMYIRSRKHAEQRIIVLGPSERNRLKEQASTASDYNPLEW